MRTYFEAMLNKSLFPATCSQLAVAAARSTEVAMPLLVPAAQLAPEAFDCPGEELGKGQNGVSANGVAANSMCFGRGTFWVLPFTYFIFPKVPGRTFFPNPSKVITFAAAPLVSTPFVRNQGAAAAAEGRGRAVQADRGAPGGPRAPAGRSQWPEQLAR